MSQGIITIEGGNVLVRMVKQKIDIKYRPNDEAELAALSDDAWTLLQVKEFFSEQVLFSRAQDNQCPRLLRKISKSIEVLCTLIFVIFS